MKEQEPISPVKPELTTQPKNRYSRGGDIFMAESPDSVFRENTKAKQQSQDQKQEQKTVFAKDLAKTPDAQKQAKKGVDEFAGEEYKKKEQEEEEKRRPPEQKAEEENEESKSKITPAQRQKYFREVPTEPIMQKYINAFCADVNDKPLETLETSFLTKSYLLLRRRAEEKGVSLTFLSSIRQTLSNRGVDVDKVYTAGQQAVQKIETFVDIKRRTGKQIDETTKELLKKGIVPMSGGAPDLNLDGITRGSSLWQIGDAINSQIAILGEESFDILNQRYGEVVALNGTVPANEKRMLLDQISAAMGRAKVRERERMAESQRENEEDRREQRERGWYGERRITREDREMIKRQIDDLYVRGIKDPIDKFFNRMFDRADSNPHVDFEHAMGGAGSQEFQYWLTLLNDLKTEARAEPNPDKADKIGELIKRYSQEHKLREVLHNAYFIADTGGEAKQFSGYTTQFASEFTDLAFLDAPEVETALRIREQVLYQIKRENNGRIPYEKVAFIAEKGWSEFEVRSEKMMREANQKGMFGDTPLDDWKIDRALSISRGLGMVLLRFPEIVAECRLTAPPETNESQPSIPWETISWELNPLDHKIKRYRVARHMSALLYASVTRKKGRFKLWNQDELHQAMAMDAIDSLANLDGEERMADLRNLTKIGGWATHSGWRSWIAGLKEDQSGLRELLARNPGLGIRLLWNKYEIKDLAAKKKEFIQEYKRAHTDFDEKSKEFLEAWQKKEKELKAENPDGKWKEADLGTWQDSARRIPHILLRVITDDANKLLNKRQTDALLKEIFKDERDRSLEGGDLQKAYTQTETDLTLAKERLMQRRRLAGTGFTQTEDEIRNEDILYVIKDTEPDYEDRIRRAMALRDKIKEVFRVDNAEYKELREKIIVKVKNRSFPFAITTEDVAFSEFRFAQTGGRGLITRRNNDWFKEVEANEAINELMKSINLYQQPEQIVEQLVKIFKHAEVHDYDRALETIEFLAKGIIRMYQKDGALKIPVLGEIMGFVGVLGGRGRSFAQTAYGQTAMAWDSDDIYSFTEHLRQKIFIGPDGKAILDRLRKETGGTIWHAIGKKTKIAFYLLVLFFGYEMAEKIIKEKR